MLDRADVLRIYAGNLRDYPLQWKLTKARIQINTSAVVANRYIYVTNYADDIPMAYLIGPAVPASQANALTLGPVQHLGGSATYGETGGYIGLTGEGITIQGKDSVRFNVDSNQAGDTWTVALTFKYIGWSAEEWQKQVIL